MRVDSGRRPLYYVVDDAGSENLLTDAFGEFYTATGDDKRDRGHREASKS